MHETYEWRGLLHIYECCTSFNPKERPTVTHVLSSLNQTKHFKIIPLEVSQNTPLERLDQSIDVGSKSGAEIVDNSDNATNVCSFIWVTPGYLLSTSKQEIFHSQCPIQPKTLEAVKSGIKDFPPHYNSCRDVGKMHDVQEAYTILREAGVVYMDYELSEEILSVSFMYSKEGKQELYDALEKLKRQSIQRIRDHLYL